jgi:hypothetical protein
MVDAALIKALGEVILACENGANLPYPDKALDRHEKIVGVNFTNHVVAELTRDYYIGDKKEESSPES